jgi:tetratricopeptide (TPR) repeat protein
MSQSTAPSPSPSRLERLRSFLAQDPENLPLIADAAQAARDEGNPDETERLLRRYATLAPLPKDLRNLQGIAAIDAGRFAEAARMFDLLLATDPLNPGFRFNRAWCAALLADYAAADSLLDEPTIAVSERGPALKIRMLHHLGRLDEALAEGERLSTLFPDDQALSGALATLSLDAERLDLAAHYAERAPNRYDALAVLGVLRLGEDQFNEAEGLFDLALAMRPDDARSLLGRGLAAVAKGEAKDGAEYLDRAAEGFAAHLGSWIAAGWAHFIDGDAAGARARFDRAMVIDDTFAETHGSLAVLDVTEGRLAEAERETEVALRLDRRCFSAALAKSLILSSRGEMKSAERVREIALNTPIGAGGRTLAQMLASMAITPPRR